MQTRDKTERFFSIVLESKNQINNMSMTKHRQKDSIVIEGTIGNIIKATFAEGIILEVAGTKGTLRLDLQAQEIEVNTQNGGA